MSFQFNVNDTLERPSRVSFIKLSEESNESCQGIVTSPQAITIAEERTIFLAATSVKKNSWKDSVGPSQRLSASLNTTTEVVLDSMTMEISVPLVSNISAQANVSSIRPKMVEVKSYAVKINKTKVVINGGTRATLANAAALFDKYLSADIGGIWSSDPAISNENIVSRAEIYLESILRKNDVTNAEVEALHAANVFLAENDQELKRLIQLHTDRVTSLGMDGAILLTQSECPFGFNEARCLEAFEGHSNFATLLDIAKTGAVRTIPDTFIPQGVNFDPPGNQRKFAKVFLAHALKSVLEGQAMIVETNSINAIDAVECHYSECVFQTKPGAPLGRCCMNLSKNDSGFILNTPESKDGADF